MEPRLIYGRSEVVLPTLPDASVDLVICDPPYGIGKEPWDRWDTDAAYLGFLRGIVHQLQRVLKPQGSLYLFCSPDKSTEVTGLVGEFFNVLNFIRWNKQAGWHNKLGKHKLRKFVSGWEGIIFAEQRGQDVVSVRKRVWGAYLSANAKVSTRQIQNLFPTKTGGVSSVWSNWLNGRNAPTPAQYAKLRELLALDRSWEDLEREYQQNLRYFNPGIVAFDNLECPPVHPQHREHSCQKPQALLAFLINASSKPGDLVLDPFMGTGGVYTATQKLERGFIGIEANPAHFQ